MDYDQEIILNMFSDRAKAITTKFRVLINT